MTHSLHMILATVSSLVLLVACGPTPDQMATMTADTRTETSTSTTTPTPTETSTPTVAPTATRSPTVTPISTPVPDIPTPALTRHILDDLFFGGSSPDCRLPCWHDLRVNVSDRDDIQHMFDTVFGFRRFLYPLSDFFASPPHGYDTIGHYWGLGSENRYGQFYLLADINKSTGKLATLDFQFHTRLTEYRPDVRPQRILRELGAPVLWLVSLPEHGGQGDNFHLRMSSLMVYDDGISFYHPMDLHVDSPFTQNGVEVFSTEFCLDTYFDSIATIGEPLADGFNNLTPAQEPIYGIRDGMVPIEEVFSISAEEIARRVTNENHLCLPISD
jgi:hypothetical protein